MPGRDDGPSGILLIDKPADWTSHDVVAKARGICKQRRIGHTGTLDPMATGLLVLCLGRATRLVEYMTGHDKRYEGVIQLGTTTTTDDAQGEIVARAPVPPFSESGLARLEGLFTGELSQVPPAFSAVKVNGQRSYAVARKGGEVRLAPRAVRVHRLALRPLAADQLALRVHCGPGTYVRSLARDIGEELGCGGHLGQLRRTAVGGFDIAEALTLDELTAAVTTGRFAQLLLPPDEGLPAMPVACFESASAAALRNGRVLRPGERMPSALPALRLYDSEGYFAGIGALNPDGTLRLTKGFGEASPRTSFMSLSDSLAD